MGLQVLSLRFRHPSGEGEVAVAEWTVESGQCIALTGPSGAGKTTLLRLIAGILKPQSGQVRFNGDNLLAMGERARRAHRLRHMGVVFQDFALLGYLTVTENLALPRALGDGTQADTTTRARELAEKLEIGKYWDSPAAQLSQGERQRVAIARALVHQPEMVLADEPTASLDARRKLSAAKLMLDDARERKAVLVMVTHDPELLPLFDRVVALEDLRP